jgi:hypothetical protein
MPKCRNYSYATMKKNGCQKESLVGLRHAQNEQVRAAYGGTAATWRQTVLSGFKEDEDNLAALRILEEEARMQDEAVTAAKQSVTIIGIQYLTGTVSFLSVIVFQAPRLLNRIDFTRRKGYFYEVFVYTINGRKQFWSFLPAPVWS